MSLKQDFINYVESNMNANPMPENLIDYWNKFKGNTGEDKPRFTENGKLILIFLKDHYKENNTWKAKDIAEQLFVSSRTVSGSIRKLVTDGYVEKIGQEPTVYSLTEKGIETTID